VGKLPCCLQSRSGTIIAVLTPGIFVSTQSVAAPLTTIIKLKGLNDVEKRKSARQRAI
jgi:hypothetical protein